MIEDNIIRAMDGKPHEAMTLDQVIDALAKGTGYIAEPGYIEEIARLARLGKAVEAIPPNYVIGKPDPDQPCGYWSVGEWKGQFEFFDSTFGLAIDAATYAVTCAKNQTETDSFYDEGSDRYFDDEEQAFDHYYPAQPHEVPEFLYGTKRLEIDPEQAKRAALKVIDFIDNDYLEMSGEDEYFSEMLKDKDERSLQEGIRRWMQHVCETIVPNMEDKTEFRKAYAEWLADA